MAPAAGGLGRASGAPLFLCTLSCGTQRRNGSGTGNFCGGMGMTQRIFTLANQLTLLRLLLIPFFALAIIGGHYEWGLGVLAAAALTDFLDGQLARRLEQRTALGMTLDPVADKLLLSTSFIVLAVRGDVPWWLSILVLSRDGLILVIALALIIGTGSRTFAPSLYGKACTSAQMVTVLAAVVAEVAPFESLQWAKEALLWLTAALTVLSGVHYAYRTAKALPEAAPRG